MPAFGASGAAAPQSTPAFGQPSFGLFGQSTPASGQSAAASQASPAFGLTPPASGSSAAANSPGLALFGQSAPAASQPSQPFLQSNAASSAQPAPAFGGLGAFVASSAAPSSAASKHQGFALPLAPILFILCLQLHTLILQATAVSLLHPDENPTCPLLIFGRFTASPASNTLQAS